MKGVDIIKHKKRLGKGSVSCLTQFKIPNHHKGLAQNKEPNILYNKNKNFPILSTLKAFIVFIYAMSLSTMNVYAVHKLEGGNMTIDKLGTVIKQLASKVQIFGIVLSFIALVVFVIQFIIGDDETKQRRKKTILYTNYLKTYLF